MGISCSNISCSGINYLTRYRPSFPFSTAGLSSVPLNLQRKVIYINSDFDWNNPEQAIKDAIDAGFNYINLSFWISAGGQSSLPVPGPSDACWAWVNVLTSERRTSTLQYAHDRNAYILVSAGGATDFPYGQDPITYANQVTDFCNQYQLDGIDYDLEGIQSGWTAYPYLNNQQLYDWFKAMFAQTKTKLGSGKLITSAPQSPYYCPALCSNTLGYSKVYQDSPFIDFFNIQYYNQSATAYDSYDKTFIKADDLWFPGTAILQISQYVPINKLVFGSYIQETDASNGPHDPQTLNSWFAQAQKDLGWTPSVMAWQWHNTGTPTPKNWLDGVIGV